MTISLTYAELKALKPRANLLKAKSAIFGPAKNRTASVTFQQLKDDGAKFHDIVWIALELSINNPDCKRRLGLWGTDCAARVLSIYEKHQTSAAPRNAIIASRQFARGEINAAERDAAMADARVAAQIAAAWVPAWAPSRTAEIVAAWNAAWNAARAAARAAAWATARPAEISSAWDAEGAVEKLWQFERLVDRMSDPEPEDWPLPKLPTKRAAK